MQGLYNQAWGWEDVAKRKELASSAARFLIARDAEGQPHAFAHFRCVSPEQKLKWQLL